MTIITHTCHLFPPAEAAALAAKLTAEEAVAAAAGEADGWTYAVVTSPETPMCKVSVTDAEGFFLGHL